MGTKQRDFCFRTMELLPLNYVFEEVRQHHSLLEVGAHVLCQKFLYDIWNICQGHSFPASIVVCKPFFVTTLVPSHEGIERYEMVAELLNKRCKRKTYGF